MLQNLVEKHPVQAKIAADFRLQEAVSIGKRGRTLNGEAGAEMPGAAVPRVRRCERENVPGCDYGPESIGHCVTVRRCYMAAAILE
jgi:hypothetical protein